MGAMTGVLGSQMMIFGGRGVGARPHHVGMKALTYFQAHSIIVLTGDPLRHMLYKPEVSGWLIKWVVELFEFDINFQTRHAHKG